MAYKHEQRYYPPAIATEPPGGVIIPGYFICPVTGAIMRDPVTTRGGATCEREAVSYRSQQALPLACDF